MQSRSLKLDELTNRCKQLVLTLFNKVSKYVYLRRREDLNLRNPLGVNLISSEAH